MTTDTNKMHQALQATSDLLREMGHTPNPPEGEKCKKCLLHQQVAEALEQA